MYALHYVSSAENIVVYWKHDEIVCHGFDGFA